LNVNSPREGCVSAAITVQMTAYVPAAPPVTGTER
jgi:hypothetical protein